MALRNSIINNYIVVVVYNARAMLFAFLNKKYAPSSYRDCFSHCYNRNIVHTT
jgi:hypothetical protein